MGFNSGFKGLNPNSNTLECDRRWHNSPAACVIAQKYSSATFVLLGFHYRKEKFGVRLKMQFVRNFTLFLNFVILKLR